MSIALFTVGFGRPELLRHQKRLLDKFLDDDFGLCMIDNTPGFMRSMMQDACEECGVGYMHTPGDKTGHNDALNFAARHSAANGYENFGFLDADIFPRKHTTLIDKLAKSGFYALPQTYKPLGVSYPWPGFCFFTSEWINGREMNFDGIRAIDRRDDGDCGSSLYSLFSHEDWLRAPLISFGYRSIRNPLEENECIQSWGYEIIGDWVHLMNSSHWLSVPQPAQRDRLLMQMIECL